MATVNRYTQLPVAQYNPMSMQELAFAPTFLRQRHDATAEALANLEQASGQYDVLDPYRVVANQAVDPLQKGITNIAEQLATQGVNRSNAVAEAMKLKSQYTNLFGQAGAIGQLQNATKQYRTQAEAIQKQFENNPELARAALARLKPGEATYQDGKLTLGQMQSPTLYRHIADEEIMKQLNTAVAALKPSDFGDMGITGIQSAGDFNDLITAASQQRVSPERILGVMQANLGPEAMNSILQYADLVQGIGRDQTVDLKDKSGKVVQTIPAGFADFYNRMVTAASNLAYTDTDIQRYLRSDEMALFRAKQQEMNMPFSSDGSRINVDVVNPYANLSIDKETNNLVVKGITNPQGQQYLDANGNIVHESVATEVVSTNQFGESIKVLKPGFKVTTASQTPEGSKLLKEFRALKNSRDDLKNLTDEQALKKVNDYYQNLTQSYGTVTRTSLNNPNFIKATLGRAMNSSVFTTDGKSADLQELIKENGYKSYGDFIDKNKVAYQGYRKFGPNGKIVHEFVMDSGQAFFVEAEHNLQNLSQRSAGFNQLIISGQLSDNFKPSMVQLSDGNIIEVQEVNINPVASNSEPYTLKLYPKDSRVNLNDVVLNRLKGKTPEQARSILQSQYGYSPSEFKIETMSEINKKENDSINQILPYMNN